MFEKLAEPYYTYVSQNTTYLHYNNWDKELFRQLFIYKITSHF